MYGLCTGSLAALTALCAVFCTNALHLTGRWACGESADREKEGVPLPVCTRCMLVRLCGRGSWCYKEKEADESKAGSGERTTDGGFAGAVWTSMVWERRGRGGD